MKKQCKVILQNNKYDCAFACLAMLFSYKDIEVPTSAFTENEIIGRDGVSLKDLKDICTKKQATLKIYRVEKEEFKKLRVNINKPYLVYWNNNHYVILEKIKKNKIVIIDPAVGRITISGDVSYLTATLRSLLTVNKFAGNSGVDVTEMLPAYNADYILVYLSSVYGMLAAILICCILAVLILTVFHTAMRQKNQLGMMMGCGCGMIFLVSFLINVLENVGAFPPAATFMPFLSAGGSYIIVSYGLMGIVLSIYRYKNVYPQHVRIRQNKNRIISRVSL